MPLTIEDYSEKAIVLRGEPNNPSELIKMKGLYNDRLKGGSGWIFSKKKRDEVLKFIENDKKLVNTSIITTNASSSKVNEEAKKMTYQEMYLWIQKTSHKFSIGEKLTLIHLLSKPETTTPVEKPKIVVPIQKRTVVADEDIEIEDEEEDEEPPKSLLTMKPKKK